MRDVVASSARRLLTAPGALGYVVFAATAIAYLVVYTTNLGHPPTTFDYLSILNTTLPLVFVAIGQSLVVITGGIDLSVGGVVSLCVTVTATRVQGGGASAIGWLLVVLALGTLCGTVNGVMVAKARIAPILTTLATLSIFTGLALWVLPVPGGSIAPTVRLALTHPSIPTGLVWLGLAVAGWYVLRRTTFGLWVYAVGSDEGSAVALGVPAARVKIAVYGLSGLCGALAAAFYVSRTTAGDANAGAPFILTSIASVVVGGVAFTGGRGSALGAMAGAAALALVIDVLFFAGIDPLYQSLFQGLFLVVAVLLGTGAALVARRRRGAP
jgi:ribose transport system permease protein